ncbi:hypothetical protein [Priestia megaterium]|uniref:hypothetical protein n=1 Tax=Priestia megaterium TaxID=1404 RepID=UPI0013E29EED|nr:hypothetical protein [Priestia megaterium]MED3864430.1 hypothetical protein [Priestia megaterium]MED4102049.1 hypothetical protein [Priestia megaterium]MED4146402.1 hypothetical protein [Priestia megaterium]MED4168135.1 hypothetical protein [Priestia megaterium]MED4201564.1 hypothetical protein [Priestia megaterium]
MSTNNRYNNTEEISTVSKKEEHPTKECETQNQTALTKEDFSLNDSAIKHFSR